jgi:hypothetical protein
METELVAGQGGLYPKFVNEQHGDKDNGSSEEKGDQTRDLIAVA